MPIFCLNTLLTKLFRSGLWQASKRIPIGKFPTASSRKRRIPRVGFGMVIFRDPESRIRDRNFLFWARSKNPEIPESPGIGIEILKSGKIPSEKSRKFRNHGDRDRALKTSKKSRVRNSENAEIPGIGIWIWKFRKYFEKIPKKSRVENPGNPEIPGIRDFSRLGTFIFGIPDCFESRNFNHRDSGSFLTSGFLSPGFSRSPRNSGFFYLRDIGLPRPEKIKQRLR